jgi:hypothetical protein
METFYADEIFRPTTILSLQTLFPIKVSERGYYS